MRRSCIAISCLVISLTALLCLFSSVAALRWLIGPTPLAQIQAYPTPWPSSTPTATPAPPPKLTLKWEQCGPLGTANPMVGYGIHGLTVDSRNPDVLYAAEYGNVWKSTDSCKSWKSLTQVDAYSPLMQDPTDPDRMYVATYGSGIRSLDGGKTWSKMPKGVIVATVDDHGRLWGSEGLAWYPHTGYPWPKKVYKSEDHGQSWQDVTPFDSWRWRTVREAPANADRPVPIGFFVSKDNGAHWLQIATYDRIWQHESESYESKVDGIQYYLADLKTGEVYVLVEVDFLYVMFKTHDGGQSWSIEKPTSKIPPYFWATENGRAVFENAMANFPLPPPTSDVQLATDPKNQDIMILYVFFIEPIDLDGVPVPPFFRQYPQMVTSFLSFDGGNSWAEVDPPPPWSAKREPTSVADFPYMGPISLISSGDKLRIYKTTFRLVWRATTGLPK